MSEPQPNMNGHGRRILLVEDHEETARMIMIILDEQGYEHTWVDSANLALNLLCAKASNGEPLPDAMLLDLTMADMDPLDMVAELRRHSPVRPPIIILSAKPRETVLQAAASINAAGVVFKPFSIAELVSKLERVLTGAT